MSNYDYTIPLIIADHFGLTDVIRMNINFEMGSLPTLSVTMRVKDQEPLGDSLKKELKRYKLVEIKEPTTQTSEEEGDK